MLKDFRSEISSLLQVFKTTQPNVGPPPGISFNPNHHITIEQQQQSLPGQSMFNNQYSQNFQTNPQFSQSVQNVQGSPPNYHVPPSNPTPPSPPNQTPPTNPTPVNSQSSFKFQQDKMIPFSALIAMDGLAQRQAILMRWQ
eukprot:gb/GEZN01010744.1/.p1 GENE.gb/GEZN01010744.1/~~gb/GEZN01010744.1/.p1  ORF type:complete len:141 (+),score=16.98 gb/GEZN01010744.1/:485-907(+)